MRPTPSISLAAAPSSDVSRVAVELAVNQFSSDIEELTTGPIVLVADSIGGALSAGILGAPRQSSLHLVHIGVAAAERAA